MPERPIAAIVLAAGASRRFGAPNKLLAELGGRTLIARTLEAVAASGIADVIVVTGWESERVAQALAGQRVRLVHNPAWDTGMGSSVAVGIGAVDPACAGALIVPGDMPLLSAQAVVALVAAFRAADAARVTYAVTPEGEQRNPVIWPRRYFAPLRALSGPAGAKALLTELAPSDRCPVAVEASALTDIDTQAELAAVHRLAE